MARLLRGDVYWAQLDTSIGHEQSGVRPVLILSNDFFNQYSGTAIVVALTSQPQKAGFPLTLELRDQSMPKKSWAKISQIRTLSTTRLSKRITHLSNDEIDRIIEGLNEILS